MFMRLLKLNIILIYFIESIGIYYLPSAVYADEKWALRPAATLVSVMPPDTVKNSSSGRPKAEKDRTKLTRTDELNSILEKNPKLKTADELLQYLVKHERTDLLKGIPPIKTRSFLNEFLFLRYETKPLSKRLMRRLPGMKVGERIAAIREERRKTADEVAEDTRLSKAIYYEIEKRDEVPYLARLSRISKGLGVDPFRIINGRGWARVSAKLKGKDHEKAGLYRERKGWTPRDLVRKLEKARFKFGPKTMPGKVYRIEGIEAGEIIPSLEEAQAIRKVYGDEGLFEEVKKTKAAKAGAKAGEAAGGPEEDKKGWKIMEGILLGVAHSFLAKDWEEIAGKTVSEIFKKFPKEVIKRSTLRNFLTKYPEAYDYYNIKVEEKKIKSRLSMKTGVKDREADFAVEVALSVYEGLRSDKIIEVLSAGGGEEDDTESKPEEDSSAKGYFESEGQPEPEEYPEEEDGDENAADSLAAKVRKYTTPAQEKRFPERWGVSGEDVEEAIELLEDNLPYLVALYEAMSQEEAGEKQESEEEVLARERLGEAIALLPTLRNLVSTYLCDWDEMNIRERVEEITRYPMNDLEKARAFEKEARERIGLALGDGAYPDTPASETLSSLKGDSLNRANLIVAMLRSVGISARYRIMRLSKEMVKGMIPPDIYQEMDEEIEHVVAEALITDEGVPDEVLPEGLWISLAGEAFFNNRWMRLEEIEAEEVGQSRYYYDIDDFAFEKAKKQSHRMRDRMEAYRRERTDVLQEIAGIVQELIKDKAIRQSA